MDGHPGRFLTQLHSAQFFEMLPDILNAIQQTSSEVDNSSYDLALFTLVMLLSHLWVLTPIELLLITPLFDLALSASIEGR